jgi:membrane protein implicated in regulation of membrane protease activity
MKKHLTRQEEFDILKIVIDKFLLLGVFLLAFGMYNIITASTSMVLGLSVMLGGVVLLIILCVILIREYEFIKN